MHASVGMHSIDACPHSGHVKSEVVSIADVISDSTESLIVRSLSGSHNERLEALTLAEKVAHDTLYFSKVLLADSS